MNNIFLKIVTVFFLLFNVSNAQNITNTLGASGLFSVKDESTTFLWLSQSNGYLSLNNSMNLPNTTGSTLGVIFKGGARFIHDYKLIWSDGYNTFVGINSGNFTLGGVTNTYGSYNTAFGHSTLKSLSLGSHNSAFGVASLNLNTTGTNNSAFGADALAVNQLASNNSAFGSNSLHSNTSGSTNSAFGSFSMYSNQTGSGNSAFGWSSLGSNTTGNSNSAFGTGALSYNTTGSPNTAMGSSAMNLNTTGFENTAVGYRSLWSNSTGWQNTAIGDSALFNNTGSYNTALGYAAGSTITAGYNLTCLGIGAIPSSPTAIDQITLGNIYVNSLRCNVQTITSLSDERDKKNIKDLKLGLDFITKLKPRQFNWDRRDWYEAGVSDGSKIQQTTTAGFIAQEFDKVQKSEDAEWLNLVLKDNPDKWEATYGNLLPVMVKAIQELKMDNDELKSEIENLKKEQLAEIQSLKDELIEQIKLLKTYNGDEDIKFSSAGN